MRYKLAFLLVLALITSCFLASASVTCNPNSVSVTTTEGIPISNQIISCSNSDVNNSVTINSLGSYFSTSPSSPITLNPGEANKQITLSFSLPPKGNYAGYLYFNDSSPIIPVNIQVNEAQQGQCNIDVFPLVLSNIKVVQGEKKTRNVQITVPGCYTNAITIQGVSLQTDEKPITLAEISLGKIQPGNSINIPLDINAENNVAVGTYSDILQILLYNSTGSKITIPTISISVTVTSGISPMSNFSDFGSLPICSLDAVEMNINDTHQLTCTINNPNFNVAPIIDTKFINGVSVSETATQFIYRFKAVSIGTTTIKANFLYKNAPIGNPFSQELRISYSGASPLSGTSLSLNFYQSGYKKSYDALSTGETTVLVLDEHTNSTVVPYDLYLNGIRINNTFSVEAGKNYELIASANGYVSRTLQLKVENVPLSFSIEPIKDAYETGESVNLTSSPEGATFLLDNTIIATPLTLSEGTHVLKAVKEGYLDALKNITVKTTITPIAISDDFPKWRNGKTIVIQISKNSTWEVTRDGSQIANGEGNIIKFKIDKLIGNWKITAGENTILEHSFSQRTFSEFLTGIPWYGWVIAFGLVMFLIWLLFIRDTESSGGSTGFYNVGKPQE